MEASQSAMTRAGVLSFIGVALLYIAGFGCVRHPMMALIALLVPMAWSFGYIMLSVGHLNILSSAFATIVIGLGSDYGVYHIAQYLRLRGREPAHPRGPAGDGPQRRPRHHDRRRGHGAGVLHDRAERLPGHRRVGHHRRRRHRCCAGSPSLTTLPAMIQWSDAKRPPWKAPAPLDVYGWLSPLVELARAAAWRPTWP